MTDHNKNDYEHESHTSYPVVIVMDEKEQRFYDRLREKLREKVHIYRDKLGDRAFDYLMLLPDLFVLFVRLAKDRRVVNDVKVVAGIVLVYIMAPIDLIPDLIVPVGYLDDVVLAVYALKRILLDVDQKIVREHWAGDVDILENVQEIVKQADNLVGSRVVNAIRRRIFK